VSESVVSSDYSKDKVINQKQIYLYS
jgi:hypothetical protein